MNLERFLSSSDGKMISSSSPPCVACSLESKNAEVFLMAHMKVCQPNTRDKGNDFRKFVEVSWEFARIRARFVRYRNQRRLQWCLGRSYFLM